MYSQSGLHVQEARVFGDILFYSSWARLRFEMFQTLDSCNRTFRFDDLVGDNNDVKDFPCLISAGGDTAVFSGYTIRSSPFAGPTCRCFAFGGAEAMSLSMRHMSAGTDLKNLVRRGTHSSSESWRFVVNAVSLAMAST